MHKTRIIIHQPKNFKSRYYRYYNIFFDLLIQEVYKNFDILESRYYKYANSKQYPANLLCQDNSINMLECEMIIENYETKEIKILSMSDDLTAAILNLQNSDYLNKVLVSQFNRNKILSHIQNTNNYSKYSPWIYFPQNDHNYEYYYSIRNQKTNLIDKFYFRGTSLESRTIIQGFNNSLFEGGSTIGDFDKYAKDLLNYKAAFSIAGRGEFCYRDIECMAMGIPLIRFKYNSEMNPNLIPDYHYISVDRPDEIILDNQLNSSHAYLIEDKFIQIKNDVNFLNFISDNAKNYYDNYIKGINGVNHTIKLLELDKWIQKCN
jgi:hypothetical protein